VSKIIPVVDYQAGPEIITKFWRWPSQSHKNLLQGAV